MKITITRDKKLLWALILSTFLYIAVYIMAYISKGIARGVEIKFGFLFYLGIIIALAIHLFLINSIYQKINLKGNVVRVGLTSMQAFYCNTITNIHFGKKIELKFKGIIKKFKISVIDIDNNEDKYRQLIAHIKARVKVSIDEDRAIQSLKANKKYANDESLTIGGWLIALLIWLIFGVISHVLYISIFILKLPFKVNEVATHFILLPFVVFILIMMLARKKRFAQYLKGYFVLEFVVVTVSAIITKITQNQLHNMLSYIVLVLNPINMLLLTIVKCRIVDISQRIKKTFIN